jgi:uncharacterized protein HemX
MGETLAYIVNSAAWSAAGFLIGTLFTRGAKEVHEIREAVVEDDSKQHRHAPPTNRLIGIVVVILAVITVANSAYFTWQQQQVSDCQADVNSQFIEALKSRSSTADDDRTALKELATTIVNHPEQAGEALQDYVSTLKASDKERKRNPLPPLPEETCG